MKVLAKALDRAKVNYIWYVFTNDEEAIDSENVIYMKPRLDVSKWISKADYVVQLSDTEACSYTINEALYRNIPVIVTPLPYLEEIGYKDGKTGYTLEFDCSNIDDIVNKIQNKPVFKFKRLNDIYGELFTNKPSEYKEENMRAKVKCTNSYYDIILKRMVEKDEEQIVDIERAEYLIGLGLVELIERVEVKPEKEDKKLPTKKATKR